MPSGSFFCISSGWSRPEPDAASFQLGKNASRRRSLRAAECSGDRSSLTTSGGEDRWWEVVKWVVPADGGSWLMGKPVTVGDRSCGEGDDASKLLAAPDMLLISCCWSGWPQRWCPHAIEDNGPPPLTPSDLVPPLPLGA